MAKYLNLTANATLLGAIPGQAVGLAVPSGDSIASIANVSIVVSDATLLGVTSIVLGAAPKEIASRNYAAGQWVSFNLAALRVVSGGEVASVKISYTTAAGLKRSDLLQILVTEAELVAEVQELTGAAAAFASALDLITVTAQTDLDEIRIQVLGDSAPQAGVTTLYVAVDGNDANDGSLNSPKATIGGVKTAVRALVAAGLTQPVNVVLRGGVYRLAATESFTVLDSGTDDYPITWQSYAGETVTIKGSKVVSGTWQTHSGSIMRLDLPGQAEFRTLWVNGVRAVRARTPNLGSYYLMAPYQGEVSEKDYFYFQPADKATGILPGEDVEVITYAGFVQDRHKFLSYDDVNERLNVVVPAGPEYGFNYRTDFGRYYLENSLSFLTEPGEFYYDPAINRLYYLPREGENLATATIEIPVTDRLFDIKGNESAADYSGDFSLFMRFKNDGTQFTADEFREATLWSTTRLSNNTKGFRVAMRKQFLDGVWLNGWLIITWIPEGAGQSFLQIRQTPDLDDNAWHSLLLSFNRTTNQLSAWIDGVAISEPPIALPGTIPNTAPQFAYQDGNTRYEGSIGDVRLIDGATNLANASALDGGNYAGLVCRAIWEFNGNWDTEGRDAALIHGSRSWSIGTGASFRSIPTFGPGWTTGKLAAVFNGTSDLVEYAALRGLPLKNVRFRGLTFEQTDWEDLEGEDSDFGDFLRERIGAAVKVEFCEDVEFSDCTLREIPTTGLWFRRSARCKALRVDARGIGYCGIAIQGVDSAAGHGNNGEHLVDDCEIRDFGFHNRAGQGVYTYFLANSKIVNNHVFDGSYIGIRCYNSLNSRFNGSGNNLIANNHVHNVMREMYDGAGIVGSGRLTGTLVRNNHVHDIVLTDLHVGPVGNIRGIYFDQGSHGVTVESNLVYRCFSSNMFFHLAINCVCRNNIFVDAYRENYGNIDVVVRTATEIGDGTTTVFNDGLVIERNICYQRDPSLANYKLGTPSAPWLAANMGATPWDQNNNLFNNGNVVRFFDASQTMLDIAYLQSHNFDLDSVVADPVFNGYLNDDFTLSGSSPAYALGFVPFEVPDFR